MNKEKRVLGVAIHGAGYVARAHAASWQKNPHAQVVSVSSRSRESAKRLADDLDLSCTIHDSFDAALRDERIDIIDITGPNHVHAEQAIAAAESSRHLLIEKPMAISLDELRRLRDSVANAGIKSVVSFVLRWNPLVQNLKSLLTSSAIGDVTYAEVDYWHRIGDWYSGWGWVRTKQMGGSASLVAGCHAIDALRWLVGKEVVEVSAFSNNKKRQFEYDPNIVAIMRFKDGTIGKTSTLLECEIPYCFNIDLIGTDGALRDNRVWSRSLLPGQTDWAKVPAINPDSGDVEHHPFAEEVSHLIDCIQQDTESHCNVADAYHTHELALAIDHSIEEKGTRVSLPLQ